MTWQIGDCLGEIHGSSFATLQAFKRDDVADPIYACDVLCNIKTFYGVFEIDLPRAGTALTAIATLGDASGEELKDFTPHNKHVYVLGEGRQGVLIGYQYDAQRLGLALVDLVEKS